MGHELYQEYDIVREQFDMAEELVKINLSRLCFKGPMEELTSTVNLQPALTTVSLATMLAIQKEGVQADITAGHSLGEYSSLCLAGVVSNADTITAVMKRGELMHRESEMHKGAMAALIGLPIDAVQAIVSETRSAGTLSIANHNMKEQIVITGSPDAVKRASDIAVSQNGRAIPLKVSGAWHSELIKRAEDDLATFFDTLSFNPPAIPVIHNVTADEVQDPQDIRSILVRQLCNPVKWYDTMQKLMAESVDVFVEVGPGRVLTGMLRKTLPGDYASKIHTVNSMKTLESLLEDVI